MRVDLEIRDVDAVGLPEDLLHAEPADPRVDPPVSLPRAGEVDVGRRVDRRLNDPPLGHERRQGDQPPDAGRVGIRAPEPEARGEQRGRHRRMHLEIERQVVVRARLRREVGPEGGEGSAPVQRLHQARRRLNHGVERVQVLRVHRHHAAVFPYGGPG